MTVMDTDLFSVKEVDGVWWVLTSITEPGDPIYKRDALGIRNLVGYEERSETWEPLASFIVRHRTLSFPTDETLVAPMTLEDALIAEGWTPPASNQESRPE